MVFLDLPVWSEKTPFRTTPFVPLYYKSLGDRILQGRTPGSESYVMKSFGEFAVKFGRSRVLQICGGMLLGSSLFLTGCGSTGQSTGNNSNPNTGSNGHSVDLSWDPSTSSGITGYQVYRGTQSGGPYSLLSASPLSTTTFTDTRVTAGTKY